MSQRSAIVEFVSFCVEVFAKTKNRSGSSVAKLFAECGAMDYLAVGYDVLHTQGREWLIADLEDYLKVRGIVA